MNSVKDKLKKKLHTADKEPGAVSAHLPDSKSGDPTADVDKNDEGNAGEQLNKAAAYLGMKLGTELTTKARKRLGESSFVFPEQRRYPIHDASHARNALARVAQHGTPEEKARVRAAVHRKFPGIGKD